MKKSFCTRKKLFLSIFMALIFGSTLLTFHSCNEEKETFEAENKTPISDTTSIENDEAEYSLNTISEENNELENNTKELSENKISEEEDSIKETSENEEELNIYLTFDDGPNRGTENLLKVIHERQVPTTFFIVGRHVNDSRSQKKMMMKLQNDSLVEIANHSYTHASNRYSKFYSDKEVVLADFNRTHDTIRPKTKIARTPGRNIWRLPNVNATDIKASKEAADYLAKNGYLLVGWDLEWAHNESMGLDSNHEAMIKRVDYVFKNKLEKTPKHLVLLTHDQYMRDKNSMKELSLFIKKLQKDKRYKFRKMSEYPHINDVLR